MMSAFGVEHGEFSKARRKQPGPTSPAAQKVADGAKAVARIPGKVVNAKVSIAGVGEAAGKGAKAVGTAAHAAATKHPGLTGAALIGGGGYAIAHNGRKGQLKPKKG